MDKINNFQINNNLYLDKTKGKELDTNDNKILKLVSNCVENIQEKAEREVPENGKFTKLLVGFDIPESQNEAFIGIEHDEINPKDTRRVAIHARRQNTDKIFSNYIFKGTKKEILEYFKAPERKEEIYEIVKNLSSKVDSSYT